MNDEDLERMLRSQAGPRERGYEAHQLPAEPTVRPGAGGSRVMRVALLASAAAAGALVVAIGAAALLPGQPSDPGVGSGSNGPSTSTSATSSAAPTSHETGACTAADIDVSAEAWGGAAGSRGTVVTIALRDGRYACTIGQTTAAWLTDGAGTKLVETEPMVADAVALMVNAEHSYTVGVAWSNWCGADVTGDVTVHLTLLGGVTLDVVPDGSASAVPPCMGDAPTNLSATDLQPAP